ncbi:MAG: tRNA (guanosine(46)-N7)-methyltransferase TrmB [Trueperaceae bacterium]
MSKTAEAGRQEVLDLPATLLPWRRLPFPAPWNAIFEGHGPLHLEVGFGDGRYTVRRALQRPNERFVGLEISTASVMRAVRRIRRERTTNVRLLKVGAQFAVRHLFAPASLSSITVNFPDPWPKERHEKNRLLRRPFFELAASRLSPKGAILLATDHPEYLEFARREALLSRLFELEEREPPREVFETKYALKWREQGKELHYQAFVNLSRGAPEFPILERPDEMPHALLTGSLPESPQFAKRVLEFAEGHVILHEVARSLSSEERERLLVRVTVDETDLKQQLLVAVQQREGSELIVRLEPFGDPVITDTARGAVHGVTEWLLEQPGVRLLERNY